MPAPITHAAQHYTRGSGATAVFETHWHAAHPLEPMPELDQPTAAAAHAVAAFVNDARWIVVCPDCGTAQAASKDDHRFLCFNCINRAVEGRFRPVKFPQNAAAIEAELNAWPHEAGGRPLRRAWQPGESVADLVQRRLDHTRPSVPRLEDLTRADADRLTKLLETTKRSSGLLPVVEWADEARTKPVVHWQKAKR